MLSFTLDTNCVLDIDEGRTDASAIRRLADAHAQGLVDVAIVAIMASEKQKAGAEIETFDQFTDRLKRLGLSHLPLCLPPFAFDITFWGHSLWATPETQILEERLHEILFPSIKGDFREFCEANGIGIPLPSAGDQKVAKWKNAKCDVYALWSHINERRDVFVTSDENFHKVTKHPALIALGAGRIDYPGRAVALIP